MTALAYDNAATSNEVLNDVGRMLAQELNEQDPHHEGPVIPVVNSLYLPEPGRLTIEVPKNIYGGKLLIGTYATRLATHRTGIYLPIGYRPSTGRTPTIMTTPLGTSARGHNQDVAEQIMAASDEAVVVMGPPRYYGPTLHALSLTQDANEMHGLLDTIESAGLVSRSETVRVYGESQAAMKGLGFIGLAKSYGREVVDGQLVAPCFLSRANFANPMETTAYGTTMLKSILAAAVRLGKSDAEKLDGTISLKDFHHHLAVLPVLLSGETGTFLPHISDSQELTIQLFGKDKSSRAHRSAQLLARTFSSMRIELYEQYGHVDGIMSPEVASTRQRLFSARV